MSQKLTVHSGMTKLDLRQSGFLDESQLSDRGAQYLSSLVNLEYLNLAGHRSLTSSGVAFVSSLTKLSSLCLAGTILISSLASPCCPALLSGHDFCSTSTSNGCIELCKVFLATCLHVSPFATTCTVACFQLYFELLKMHWYWIYSQARWTHKAQPQGWGHACRRGPLDRGGCISRVFGQPAVPECVQVTADG